MNLQTSVASWIVAQGNTVKSPLTVLILCAFAVSVGHCPSAFADTSPNIQTSFQINAFSSSLPLASPLPNPFEAPASLLSPSTASAMNQTAGQGLFPSIRTLELEPNYKPQIPAQKTASFLDTVELAPEKPEPSASKKADKVAVAVPNAKTMRAVEKLDPRSADYYIREVLGTEVQTPVAPAEETVTRQAILPPLIPGLSNGLVPLPIHGGGHKIAFADAPFYSRSRTFAYGRALLWPMRGGLVTSRFGPRWGRVHHGTDIAAPAGTPILAAANGKVIYSGWQEGYGNLVIVDHGNGIKTKYGHCSRLLVMLGETVHQGDIIGRVGSTGHATGPHLHYEVVHEGISNNPEFFTRRR